MQTFKTLYPPAVGRPFRPTTCNLLGDFWRYTLLTIFLTDYLLSVQGLAQLVSARPSVRKAPSSIDLFHRYGGHIELLPFKDYYGMPSGHDYDPLYSLSIRNMAFTLNFSGKRWSLLHPNTAQRSFFPLQSYSKKMPRKALVYGKQNLLIPPWASHTTP